MSSSLPQGSHETLKPRQSHEEKTQSPTARCLMHKQPYTVLTVTQTVAHKNKEQKTLTNNAI